MARRGALGACKCYSLCEPVVGGGWQLVCTAAAGPRGNLISKHWLLVGGRWVVRVADLIWHQRSC